MDKSKSAAILKAYQAGRNAGLAGQAMVVPYDPRREPLLYAAWRKGYEEAAAQARPQQARTADRAKDARKRGFDPSKTRLYKAHCRTCGYKVRLARVWLHKMGAPHCPAHGAMDVPEYAGF